MHTTVTSKTTATKLGAWSPKVAAIRFHCINEQSRFDSNLIPDSNLNGCSLRLKSIVIRSD